MTKTIGLWITKSGKEAMRLTESTFSGRSIYGWIGTKGAGSGQSLDAYLKEADEMVKRSRGIKVVLDPRL